MPVNIIVRNVGCAPLDISGILLQASSSPKFELLNPPGAVTLQPHAQITLDVAYTPANVGTDTGTIRIESNDPSLPIRIVSLEAEGKAVCEPKIGLGHGGSLDFVDVVVNEYHVMKIAISNSLGCTLLDVSSIQISAGTTSEFSLFSAPSSATIEPGANIKTGVRTNLWMKEPTPERFE